MNCFALHFYGKRNFVLKYLKFTLSILNFIFFFFFQWISNQPIYILIVHFIFFFEIVHFFRIYHCMYMLFCYKQFPLLGKIVEASLQRTTLYRLRWVHSKEKKWVLYTICRMKLKFKKQQKCVKIIKFVFIEILLTSDWNYCDLC